MKKTMMAMALAATVAGLGTTGCYSVYKNCASAVSPDGRNKICFSFDPLAYTVTRDGKTVVAKTEVGLRLNHTMLTHDRMVASNQITKRKIEGVADAAVYKKSKVDLSANETLIDFNAEGLAVRLIARNDGVAYRWETDRNGSATNRKEEIIIREEKAAFTIPNSKCKVYSNFSYMEGFLDTDRMKEADPFQNSWESIPEEHCAGQFKVPAGKIGYLPLVYTLEDGTAVCVTESDLVNYPGWNFGSSTVAADSSVKIDGAFAKIPEKYIYMNWGSEKPYSEKRGLRYERVTKRGDYLVKTKGTRTFPWRAFMLADNASDLVANDLVWALATPAKGDFSWVKPGKVAWDWWNNWNLQGVPFKSGCNTKTYEYYIDFAAKNGVEYVIFDEGWSQKLNIWKYNPEVDVEHLIKYAEKKGVGIILWMAWAQIVGEEERVAKHFAKLGAKGFKVDFMDRDDAKCVEFLWKFADVCAKEKMLVDYHGMFKPMGMERTYPNVLNFEGVHGLECAKWFNNDYDFPKNDIGVYFVRMSAGPMDYTPGAMDNYPIGKYRGTTENAGSVGTRCRQMAMMTMYFAPLQMLCDSPSKYEKNMECFSFMAKTPVVWDDTVGIAGDINNFGYAACARRKGDVWYAAGMTDSNEREVEVPTDYLGEGKWAAEIFRDHPEANTKPMRYIHETRIVKKGDKIALKMAKGGGYVIRFTPAGSKL